MLSDELAISVRGLSKRYIIDHRDQQSSLAEEVINFVRHPFRPAIKEEVWSVNDVSFDVRKGEILGLLGRNGAGKSTLLKMLSRITDPTHGEAILRGRLGSLIEVGTGFQPELTGRENLYLNGAILGMTRKEVRQRFDEIVAFAGVEKYLDTPVKRYSSGMYVRLAFAVAVHLDTEILLIDEVLAVGDADFQTKSVRKMIEVANSGKTIIVVSHNAATIEALCSSALLLSSGRALKMGPVQEVLQEYHKLPVQTGGQTGRMRIALGDRGHHFKSVDLLDANMASTRVFRTGDDIVIDLELEAHETIHQPTVTVTIGNALGQSVVVSRSPCNARALPDLRGSKRVVCTLSQLAIAPGEYSAKVELGSDGASLDTIEGQLQFTVANADPYEDGWGGGLSGLVVVRSDWDVA
jgi:lipopolysaccharide transport system ATP-binding protein